MSKATDILRAANSAFDDARTDYLLVQFWLGIAMLAAFPLNILAMVFAGYFCIRSGKSKLALERAITGESDAEGK